ncbi:MAG: N-6 DNA methylase [Candidatus Tenebribacter burtonii]|jgi:hypothetical protein|nr:N-6 DNA methylase [Candidatus Tenebribacter burtonii]
MSSLKSKETRFSNPFDTTVKKTERTAVAILMHWMRNIIEEKKLNLGMPDVETSGSDRKMPDLVIYETRKSQKVLLLIEAKPPYFNVFDEEELKEPARKKANRRKAKYFATTNFKKLLWFNTEKANNPNKYSEEDQLVEKYSLSEIENLDYIEQPRYKEPIKKTTEDFLIQLIAIQTGEKQEPKHPIDEFLIYRLHEKIRVLTFYYRQIIEDKCHKDFKFKKQLGRWFYDQGWNFIGQENDFEKAARQTAYLLINKILFYDVLQSKRPDRLDPLEIPKSLTKGSLLKSHLSGFFNEVLKIDYETIYDADFIDTVAFPDSIEVVKEIKELIKVLRQYDFSKIGYDVIGSLFERLIPIDERHVLGQYFTKADIVDLILRFCLHHENDKVIDPACGAGTFLVRAYHHKKLMNNRLEHEKILSTLWGVDIAKFPAHLSQINLAIKKLESDTNYPNILKDDFFSMFVGAEGFEPTEWRKRISKTLSAKERKIEHPRWFDAIVGNPPYTRQEEIEGISEKDKSYKNKIILNSLKDDKGRTIVQIGKRAGIHAYFFVHGTKFLRDGGYFGFIVSNSWLDTDYGKGLQELFLKYYKIVAIIESKVERWFDEADVNTCIVILQKCKNKKERDNNLARFVYLKKPLKYLIPPATSVWEDQIKRLQAIDSLKKTILSNINVYENDELHVFPKSQNELWEEGFDEEKNKYVGAKWGKYLRAPEIFFTILEKGKDKLIPLKEVATVKFGIKTGANDFFYITEKEIKAKGIENEFWMHKDDKGKWIPNFILKSFKQTKSISINKNDLIWKILYIKKDKKSIKSKNVFKYIKEGENRKFGKLIPSKTVTCSSRGENWFNLGNNKQTHILYPRRIGDRFLIPYSESPIYSSDNLFPVFLKEPKNKILYSSFLNSTVVALFNELYGRTLTGAINVIDMDVWMVNKIPVVDFSTISSNLKKKITQAFDKLSKRKMENTLKEILNNNEVLTFDSVSKDRRELDKIIMGDILGLTDEEQLEVYRAVVDLVKSRIEKAKSVEKKKKNKDGINVEAFIDTVMERIGEETLGSFYKKNILNQKKIKKIKLPNIGLNIFPNIDKELMGWRLYYSKKDFIICDTEEEARFIKIFIDTEIEELSVPTDTNYLSSIISNLEKIKEKVDDIINESVETIYSTKLRNNLRHQLIREIIKT